MSDRISTIFYVGLGVSALVLAIDLVVIVAAGVLRARGGAKSGICDRRGYLEGGVELCLGALMAILCVGMPVRWRSPSDVPDWFHLVAAHGSVASGPIALWGLLTVWRAVRRSHGVLGLWGRLVLLAPWILALLLVVASGLRYL